DSERTEGLVLVDIISSFCTVGGGNLAPAEPNRQISTVMEEAARLAKLFLQDEIAGFGGKGYAQTSACWISRAPLSPPETSVGIVVHSSRCALLPLTSHFMSLQTSKELPHHRTLHCRGKGCQNSAESIIPLPLPTTNWLRKMSIGMLSMCRLLLHSCFY
ncbi:hypothetical protein BHE74_00024270, partial [Ensete ventricosum]